MKHSKSKFLKSHKLNKEVVSVLDSNIAPEMTNELYQKIKNNDGNFVAHYLTEEDEFIQCFQYNTGSKVFFIPEPHPVVNNFETGRTFVKYFFGRKEELLEELNRDKKNADAINKKTYSAFSNASICCVFLFISIETLINYLIPNDFTFTKIKTKANEVYNKMQIQKHFPFEEKVKEVLTKITNKSFNIIYPEVYKRLIFLKDLRDEVVHLKSYPEQYPNQYKILYTKLLDSDYNQMALDVKQFINFYEPNLIEECPCGLLE